MPKIKICDKKTVTRTVPVIECNFLDSFIAEKIPLNLRGVFSAI